MYDSSRSMPPPPTAAFPHCTVDGLSARLLTDSRYDRCAVAAPTLQQTCWRRVHFPCPCCRNDQSRPVPLCQASSPSRRGLINWLRVSWRLDSFTVQRAANDAGFLIIGINLHHCTAHAVAHETLAMSVAWSLGRQFIVGNCDAIPARSTACNLRPSPTVALLSHPRESDARASGEDDDHPSDNNEKVVLVRSTD
ncbi:hypothetical protein CERZMDRAFT_87238 [Cercospora zeae-maydis SCOH1-5]|uniref:Uncharacterized protein n=1 Tax=Cercospora zeae-maydis SCOH1-5 TaxID=717836 RepID=A0A6A6F761_9PEZI|nr:hypothetical protein CERZMDRAFT_87238 [Cercospora zeae-maydis SCOH1-5]